MMTNEEKIYMINDRIQNINNLIVWLDNNPSTGEVPEGKMSTQQQKDKLSFEKDILLQVLDSLA